MKIKSGKNRISLRQKAVAAVFLTFALLTFYVFYFSSVEDHHRAEEEIIKAARMTAGLISAAGSEAVLNEDEIYLNKILMQAVKNRDLAYIRFVNRGGGTLAEAGLQRTGLNNPKSEKPGFEETGRPKGLLHNSGHFFHIRTPILHKGEDVGEIYMEINTVAANKALARISLRRLAIFIVTIISGALLIYFMERRMRGSLKTLIKTTGQMAEGDLSQQVEIIIGDEVEELGESFNRLAQVQIVRQERMAAMGRLVAGLAHEINNPNSFIRNNIPLLEETWRAFEPMVSEYAAAHKEIRISGLGLEELSGEMRDLIHDIKVGSDRINKIVSRLKYFVRQDERSPKSSVHVNEMIRKTMTTIGAQVYKSVGTVTLDLAPDLPSMNAHTQKLEQVVTNLVMNAVNAIPDKDKGRLSVTTRYLEMLTTLLIEVEDNGEGMGGEVIDHIFEPFFTTRRNMGGTGLGLSIAYSLIKEHHGNIGVLSRPGLGTRITVYLPVDGKKKPELQPSILCLDDDNDITDLLKSRFSDVERLSPGAVKNPGDIVEYLWEHPEIDIILLGFMISDLKSCNLIKRIKERFPLLTVITYSKDTEVKGKKSANAPTTDYFLDKPYEPERLIERINGVGRQRL